MAPTGRSLFPYLATALLAAAVIWATSFSTLPPADFTFVNGTEVRSIDPARESGQPEGRIMSALFEGLYRSHPETLKPIPAVAINHDLSPDGRTYTFHLRHKENYPADTHANERLEARWSDGTLVTAEDFRWSWQRMIHPETESEYAGLLADRVVNGLKYHRGETADGDPVEVELADRPKQHELFPRGTMLFGKQIQCVKPPQPVAAAGTSPEDHSKELAKWRDRWLYTVEIAGQKRRFCGDPAAIQAAGDGPKIEKCRQVLLDFKEVGISAPNAHTLRVTLISPTPYFLYLVAFYPLSPCPRPCIEEHGFPDWTHQKNLVCNGPYRLEFRRIRDRIRLKKSDTYWNAQNVRLPIVDALAVESETTGLNMYLDGQVDWCTAVPPYIIPRLLERKDCLAEPSLTIAFYRINVTRPPLDNSLLRQALNQAIDKQTICDKLLRAGQKPARSVVPPGLPGYESALCGPFDPKAARDLLVKAGFPDGKGVPRIEILHNSGDAHADLAQAIGSDWEKHLGIRVSYRALEWGNYLTAARSLQFSICRAGWIGDYPDPMTFLDMFLSESPNNNCGWKNPRYDALIRASALEADPRKRMQILRDAEAILMTDMPIIPNYTAVSINMVQPQVRGFYSNSQDIHPLEAMWMEKKSPATPAKVPSRGTRP